MNPAANDLELIALRDEALRLIDAFRSGRIEPALRLASARRLEELVAMVVERAGLHRTRTFLCQHVFEATHPVLYVVRAEGDWQLLCGGPHDDGPRLVGLAHLLERDPTLVEILDLPIDHEAERSAVGDVWVRRPATSFE